VCAGGEVRVWPGPCRWSTPWAPVTLHVGLIDALWEQGLLGAGQRASLAE